MIASSRRKNQQVIDRSNLVIAQKCPALRAVLLGMYLDRGGSSRLVCHMAFEPPRNA